MAVDKPVKITVFSDVLCVWAYVAQIRIDELKKRFGDAIEFDYRFIPLFGSTETRIGEGWKAKGGYEGFAKHTLEVAEQFPHVEVNPAVWAECRPKSSALTHYYIKAVQLWAESTNNLNTFEDYIWQVRLAFFKDALDISTREVLMAIAKRLDIPGELLDATMDSGEVMAALCLDNELRDKHKIEGSPTFMLNNGRQKLFGNVGYKILEANIQEVLDIGEKERASWC